MERQQKEMRENILKKTSSVEEHMAAQKKELEEKKEAKQKRFCLHLIFDFTIYFLKLFEHKKSVQCILENWLLFSLLIRGGSPLKSVQENLKYL